MHDLPMNRFYISRSFFSASRHDYATAVESLRHDLETLTARPYALTVTFKQAADPTAPEGKPPILAIVKNTADITRRLWNQADEIETRLTPQGDEKAPIDYALVTTNKRLDSRQICFDVQPPSQGQKVSRLFFENHFHFWPRGLNLR